MTSDELKARARRLAEEVLSQGDLAVAGELVSADYAHHGPGDRPRSGLVGLTEVVTLMHRTFPDFHVIVEDEIAERDRVVQRLTVRGTAHAELVAPSARAQEVSLCVIDINRAGPDGKFVEHWCSVDLVAVVEQLGATPNPARPWPVPRADPDQEK